MDFSFKIPEETTVDPLALTLIGTSLQNHEQLRIQLKNSPAQYAEKVSEKVRSTLDQLREIKSEIEGSHHGYEPTTINETPLQELRQLTLMHVPTSVTQEVKDKFKRLLGQVFEGKCEKVISAVLLTCPWYWAAQKERGEQARHNIVLVIYLGYDDQFFTPANPHDLTEGNVIDLGWLQAVELSHFGHFLVKGRTRFVEAVYSHENAVLWNTDELDKLASSLRHTEVMGLRGFVEACRGQAVGGISKKRKNGGLKLKDGTTFYHLCESCRLLQHVENVASGESISKEIVDDMLSDSGKQALGLLQALYKDPDVSRQDIFSVLLTWKDQINESLKKFKFSNNKDVEKLVGDWMAKTRLQGRQLCILNCIEDERSNLVKLMEMIGGPIQHKQPEQILLVARAGSYMYGLSTPDSDVDYVVIYAEPTMSLMSTCRQISECVENRGPEKQFEYGAYEARIFCEMVLKGSVVILELLFADSHEYMSPAWKALAAERQRFVTERAIHQYQGLIKNNFNMIDNERHIGTSKDRKLFYQIFHKLECVTGMSQGKVPSVRCRDDVREFIMRVRTQPSEGELARDKLLHRARSTYETLLSDMARRPTRLPEKIDYRFMLNWLKAVRGIS